MGQVPIRILITDSKLLEHPDINDQLDKLTKAGHEITMDDSLAKYDFITGPNCWLLRPEVAGLFSIAIKQARVIANGDKERVEQNKATVASKRAASKAAKPRARKPKVEESGESLPGQTSFVTGGSGTHDGQG